jgi:hypothetical protein
MGLDELGVNARNVHLPKIHLRRGIFFDPCDNFEQTPPLIVKFQRP